VESDFDFCARRAAEEFMAASRAETAEQRRHHRMLAEQYAERVRAILFDASATQADLTGDAKAA
jgi:hypothetical protein